MNKTWFGIVVAAFLGTSLRAGAQVRDLPVIQDVDPARYLGHWHEIALIPHWFERGCSDTTATYSLAADGRIRVLNACLRDGKLHRANAVAWHVGSARDGKFKVQFFWPFSGHYWVIALDPDYQWAVVGHPSRRYFWILSRRPTMAPTLYNQLVQQAVALGYDSSQIQLTTQSKQ